MHERVREGVILVLLLNLPCFEIEFIPRSLSADTHGHTNNRSNINGGGGGNIRSNDDNSSRGSSSNGGGVGSGNSNSGKDIGSSGGAGTYRHTNILFATFAQGNGGPKATSTGASGRSDNNKINCNTTCSGIGRGGGNIGTNKISSIV